MLACVWVVFGFIRFVYSTVFGLLTWLQIALLILFVMFVWFVFRVWFSWGSVFWVLVAALFGCGLVVCRVLVWLVVWLYTDMVVCFDWLVSLFGYLLCFVVCGLFFVLVAFDCGVFFVCFVCFDAMFIWVDVGFGFVISWLLGGFIVWLLCRVVFVGVLCLILLIVWLVVCLCLFWGVWCVLIDVCVLPVVWLA